MYDFKVNLLPISCVRKHFFHQENNFSQDIVNLTRYLSNRNKVSLQKLGQIHREIKNSSFLQRDNNRHVAKNALYEENI